MRGVRLRAVNVALTEESVTWVEESTSPAAKESTSPATKECVSPATKESASPATKENAMPVEEESATGSRRAWQPFCAGPPVGVVASKDDREVDDVGGKDLEVVVVRRDGFEPSRKTTTTARDACEAYHRER